MKISDFNRRIVFNQYAFSQDESGGNVKTLIYSFEIWAKVEPTSNNRTLEQLQITYSEAYKITTRFELSRPISANDEIIYEGKLLSIAGIKEETEGSKMFNVITAYSTGKTAEGAATPEGTLAVWQTIEW